MNRDTPKKSLEQLRERTRAWEDNEVAGFLEAPGRAAPAISHQRRNSG